MLSSVAARVAALTALMRLPGIVLASFIVIASGAAASAESLTLEQAQQLAVQRSRQIVAKESGVEAARQMAVAAGQLPDPVVTAEVNNLPLSGANRFSLTGSEMTMTSIGVMQEITRQDKRKYRSERYTREAEALATEKIATTTEIERETALAWLERFYAEAMLRLLAEQATQSQFEIEAAEGGYRGGKAGQADVFAARSALAAYQDRAREAETRVRNTKAALARWIGDAAYHSLAGTPSTDRIPFKTSELEPTLEHHPAIGVLTRRIRIAEAEASLARANKKPDWSVGLMYQQRGPAYDNMISFGVSVPLQWDQKNRQDRELAARLAMVEQARAERDDALLAHAAETRALINEWESGRERVAHYERALLPLARERTKAALAAYRGGQGKLDDVLMARRAEIDVRLQQLQLASETARLWARLNFLLPGQIHSSSHSASNGELK